MLQISVWEMYSFGAFISGWMKRQRERIVTVGIRIVIVLLSGGGGGDSLKWVCAAGGRGANIA